MTRSEDPRPQRPRGCDALAGLRVLELGGGIAASYATKLLVDLGAEVVKVEPPGGERLRARPPFPSGADGVGGRGGALFQYLNAGKGSVALGLDVARGVERLRALLERAHVLVESLGAGVLEARGLGADARKAVQPRLACVRISGFGQTGPWRDRPSSGLVLQSAGGWTARIGNPGRAPVQAGGELEQYIAGAYAAAATLSAWREAERSGRPVEADLSILECVTSILPYPMLHKVVFDRMGYPLAQRYQPIPGIVACADGWVGVNALTGQHWHDICHILGAPEYAERMREVQLRGKEWDDFRAKVEPWLAERRAEEIVELFQAARVPAAPIGHGENLPSFEQFVARKLFVPQPEAGFPRPRGAFRMSGTPLAAPRPAPRLGQDDAAVLEAWPPLGPAAPEPAARVGDAASPASRSWGGGRPGLPFSGVKILDLTSFWAGPYPTAYLACLGADVVKVETVKRPDGFRFVATGPEFGERWWERGVLWLATNLGKRSLTLDLDRPEGLALARRLVAEADVVAENYAPRVVEAFGLDYPAVREINPRAVMLRMPAFGLDGPWRHAVGWAQTFEQMGGCAQVTGDADAPPLAPGGFADPVVGMHTAVALQAALEHQRRTGQGQLVEVPQAELMVSMTAEQVLHHALTGERLTRAGNRSPEMAPQGVYPCAGDDEWVALTVRDDADWERLVRVLGAPAWCRAPALARLEGRIAAHDALDRELAAWAAPQQAAELAERLSGAGVPAAALLKHERFYEQPQLAARHYYHELDHPVVGPLRYPGWPMRFCFGPAPLFGGRAPTLGQHNEEILGGVLGLSTAEIEALRSAGVIGEGMDA